MKLQSSQSSEDPEVNLTPLIDVVFILLIFFMVSTTFQKESEIRIDLPEAGTESVVTDDIKRLDIIIDSDGRYFIGDQQLVNSEFETLTKAITNYLSPDQSAIDTDIPVTIRADRKTPYETVIRAMDATAQLGLVQMSLATNQRDLTDE
ncbi:MAG: biopolymer transporter ExbD [Gammaproteobacteria bacterium]